MPGDHQFFIGRHDIELQFALRPGDQSFCPSSRRCRRLFFELSFIRDFSMRVIVILSVVIVSPRPTYSFKHAALICVSGAAKRMPGCSRRRGHRPPVAKSADGADAADVPSSVLKPEVMLTVRVPAHPSRLKQISMPSMRRNVCARHSRPASALGVLGQPAPLVTGKMGDGSQEVRGRLAHQARSPSVSTR